MGKQLNDNTLPVQGNATCTLQAMLSCAYLAAMNNNESDKKKIMDVYNEITEFNKKVHQGSNTESRTVYQCYANSLSEKNDDIAFELMDKDFNLKSARDVFADESKDTCSFFVIVTTSVHSIGFARNKTTNKDYSSDSTGNIWEYNNNNICNEIKEDSSLNYFNGGGGYEFLLYKIKPSKNGNSVVTNIKNFDTDYLTKCLPYATSSIKTDGNKNIENRFDFIISDINKDIQLANTGINEEISLFNNTINIKKFNIDNDIGRYNIISSVNSDRSIFAVKIDNFKGTVTSYNGFCKIITNENICIYIFNYGTPLKTNVNFNKKDTGVVIYNINAKNMQALYPYPFFNTMKMVDITFGNGYVVWKRSKNDLD